MCVTWLWERFSTQQMLLRKLMHVTWHLRTIFDTTECYRDILTCVTTFLTRSLYISLRVDLNWQNESEIGSVNVWLPFSKQTEKRSIVVWTKTRRNILKKNLKDEEKNRQIFRILFGSRGILISLFWFDPTLRPPLTRDFGEPTWKQRQKSRKTPLRSHGTRSNLYETVTSIGTSWKRFLNRARWKRFLNRARWKRFLNRARWKRFLNRARRWNGILGGGVFFASLLISAQLPLSQNNNFNFSQTTLTYHLP